MRFINIEMDFTLEQLRANDPEALTKARNNWYNQVRAVLSPKLARREISEQDVEDITAHVSLVLLLKSGRACRRLRH